MPLIEAALLAKEYGAILEIDCHCRQPEMADIGVGEPLLHDLQKLGSIISKIKKTGVVLSVKTRSGIVDDRELAVAIEEAGADMIHIDAMDPGYGADYNAIKAARNATDLFIIGNNSVTDFRSAKDMFGYGADMVSLARAVPKNPGVIDDLVRSVQCAKAHLQRRGRTGTHVLLPACQAVCSHAGAPQVRDDAAGVCRLKGRTLTRNTARTWG